MNYWNSKTNGPHRVTTHLHTNISDVKPLFLTDKFVRVNRTLYTYARNLSGTSCQYALLYTTINLLIVSSTAVKMIATPFNESRGRSICYIVSAHHANAFCWVWVMIMRGRYMTYSYKHKNITTYLYKANNIRILVQCIIKSIFTVIVQCHNRVVKLYTHCRII